MAPNELLESFVFRCMAIVFVLGQPRTTIIATLSSLPVSAFFESLFSRSNIENRALGFEPHRISSNRLVNSRISFAVDSNQYVNAGLISLSVSTVFHYYFLMAAKISTNRHIFEASERYSKHNKTMRTEPSVNGCAKTGHGGIRCGVLCT